MSQLLNDSASRLADEEFLALLEVAKDGVPSWLSFALTFKSGSPKTRNHVIQELNELKISTRLLIGGILLRQHEIKDTPRRVVGDLANLKIVMNNTFWVCVWLSLTFQMLEYVVKTIHKVIGKDK